MKKIAYKGKLISLVTVVHYMEKREWDGHRSIGTGDYNKYSKNIYKVGKKEFYSLDIAKRHIRTSLNKDKIKTLKEQLKALDKKYKEIVKQIDKLST